MTKITRIETWACDTPLAQAIELGRFVVQKRSYLVVRAQTDNGLVASCVTQSRGSPLDMVVAEVIAPRIIGKCALDVAARRLELSDELTALELTGAIGRAWSAVEICLQNLRAKSFHAPLWQMLGGAPRPVPVELVEGYALANEDDEKFVARLVARVNEGFRMLKIESGHYVNHRELLRRLEMFRSAVGDAAQLVLDFGWSWRESKSNALLLRELTNFNVAWVEDPFPSHNLVGYQEMRRNHRAVPVGCGDETSDTGRLYALVEAKALDVLRLDATTMGGIEPVRALTTAGWRNEIRVSYHEHPEVHEHLVFGLGIADHIEMFPTDRPFDRVHDLIARSAYSRVRNGNLEPPDEPGAGMDSEPGQC